MEKEFDISEKIDFPSDLVIKDLEGYYIVLSPYKSNWIVLDEMEFKLFGFLKELTLIEALISFQNGSTYSEDECIELLKRVLLKVDSVEFYNSAKVYEEEPINQIIKTIHITTTNDCNLRCKHCYMSAGLGNNDYLDLVIVAEKIREIGAYYRSKLDVVVSGGEPLLHPDIEWFLKFIQHHFITLFTNGMLINKDNITYIGETCDVVQVSMEGISKNVFESVRGKNTYDRFLEGLNLLIQHDIRVVLAITVLPNTVGDVVENLIPFINSLDYNNIEVRLNHQLELTGNALLHFDKGHEDSIDNIMLDLVKSLKGIGISYESKSERNIKFNNCGIGASIVFEANGLIYPCSKYSIYYKRIDDDIKEIIKYFDSLNNISSCKDMNACQNCELRYVCAGGCKIDNYRVNGEMTFPICNDQFKNEQYKRLIKDYLRE